MSTTQPRERRWIGEGGVRIALVHRSGLGRARVNPRARDAWLTGGLIAEGYWLVTMHPVSGSVLSETPLGRDVPEATLRAALDAVGAVPHIGRWPASV